MNIVEAAIHDRQKTLRSISKLMALPDSGIREAMDRRHDICAFVGQSETPRGDLTLAMNFVLDEINRFKSYVADGAVLWGQWESKRGTDRDGANNLSI